MAQSPLVGAAYVSIRSDTSGLAQSLRRQLERQLGRVGEEAGRRFNEGFADSVQDLGDATRQSFQRAGTESGTRFFRGFNREAEQRIATFSTALRRNLASGAEGAGDVSGMLYLQRFGEAVSSARLDLARPLFADLENESADSGRRSARSYLSGLRDGFNEIRESEVAQQLSGLFRSIRNLFRREGEEAGRGFGDGINDGFGGFNLNLGPFNRSFSSLTQAILRLGPVVVIAAQALAGLAAQASALISAISSAASSLALFIPLVTALGTALAVTVIGFQGFIDGVREGGEALADLTPSARASAEALRGLRDEMGEIQDVVQQRLFADLAGPLSNLANTILPVVQQQFADTASVINNFFREFLQAAQTQQNLRDLNTVLESQNTILGNLLGAVEPVLNAFRDWLVPMLPFAEDLSAAIQRGAESLANFAAEGRETGATADFFERAYENATLLLSGIRDLTVGIVNFFSAGREEGNSMLETFAELAAQFRDFATSVEGQAAFQQFFEFGAVVVQRLASALEIVFNLLAPLTSAFSQVAGAAAPLLDTLVALSESIGQGLTIVLQPVIQGWSQLIAIFTQAANEILPVIQLSINGLAQAFSSLLSAIIPLAVQMYEQIIPAILSLLPPIIQLGTQIITALTPALTAVISAFSQIIPIIVEAVVPVLGQLITLVGEVVVALAPLIADLVSALAPILVRVAQLFAALLPVVVPLAQFIAGTLTPVIGIAIGAITALANGISSAIEWFVRWVPPVVDAARIIGGIFVDRVQTAAGNVRNFFGAIGDAIAWLRDFLQPIRDVAGAFTSGFIGVVQDAATFVADVAGAIEDAIGWFRDFIAPIQAAADAFGPLGAAVEGALALIDNIAGAVSGAIGAIEDLANAISNIPSLPSGLGAIGDIPFVPGFAAGRLVTGPTTAMIGEAGREAVIPLDRPLSQVDPSVREMAAILRGQSFASGAVVGGGRSVTVLPGAVQVSTQVADPVLVAESVVDRLAAEAAIG